MVSTVLIIVGMISVSTHKLVAQSMRKLKYPVPEGPRQVDEQCQTKQAFFPSEIFKVRLQDKWEF